MSELELKLCRADEFNDGEAREFEVEGKKILLAKEKGKFYAVGNKCSHYGGPLSKGSYCSGKVRCPWHGAVFNVQNGDIEDFPGLDSLPTFETKVHGGDVYLLVDKDALENPKRVKGTCSAEGDNNDSVVIVGGGGSAVVCAETLRQEGYKGKITILSQESTLAYDRPRLSKAADIDVEKIYLRPPEFYTKNNIAFHTNAKVTAIDLKSKTVTIADGGKLSYNNLVLATGGTPRALNCPGSDLQNICYLRTPADGQKMAKLVNDKKVVVIGSSFIGMELAAYTKGKKASSITVVGGPSSTVPFAPVFGNDIGAAIQKLHESNGVQFRMGCGVKELRGKDAKLTHVVLTDGTLLEADLCIAGIGVLPNTDFLKPSGLNLTDRGYVVVNEQMCTSDPNVYACGDIASFPLKCFSLPSVNVQHWQMAMKHGRTAALAIAGKAENIDTVPFFWSMMFGKSVRYTGYGPGYDQIILRGNPDDFKFVAYFLKDDSLRAVATMGSDPVAAKIADCFRVCKTITKDDIEKNENDDWSGWLK